MKIKLDENMPDALAEQLRQNGHDTDTVPDEALAGQDDATIWLAARRERRFLVGLPHEHDDTSPSLFSVCALCIR